MKIDNVLSILFFIRFDIVAFSTLSHLNFLLQKSNVREKK